MSQERVLRVVCARSRGHVCACVCIRASVRVRVRVRVRARTIVGRREDWERELTCASG